MEHINKGTKFRIYESGNTDLKFEEYFNSRIINYPASVIAYSFFLRKNGLFGKKIFSLAILYINESKIDELQEILESILVPYFKENDGYVDTLTFDASKLIEADFFKNNMPNIYVL